MNTPTQQELHRERLAAGDPAETAAQHIEHALAAGTEPLPRHRHWLSVAGPRTLVRRARTAGWAV